MTEPQPVTNGPAKSGDVDTTGDGVVSGRAWHRNIMLWLALLAIVAAIGGLAVDPSMAWAALLAVSTAVLVVNLIDLGRSATAPTQFFRIGAVPLAVRKPAPLFPMPIWSKAISTDAPSATRSQISSMPAPTG
jgi:hypothetical protein